MPVHLHEDHLDSNHFSFTSNQLSLISSSNVHHVRANIDFETTSPFTVATVPLGAIVTKVIISTITAFDGAGATIDLGVSGNTSKYAYNGDYNITTVNDYIKHLYEREIAQTNILADIYSDSSTAGAVEILIEYSTE